MAPIVGGGDEQAFPETYTQPPKEQPKEKKSGQMTEEQLKHFYKHGYVILENFIDAQILEQIKKELHEQVEEMADKLFKAGKIQDKHVDKDLFHRMIHLNRQFPGVSVLHHRSDHMTKTIKELWRNEKLLDAVEQIVGTEIAGHPVWNLRIKLPRNEPEEVPWHQDNGYFEADALGTMICTAWIPLLDTFKSNGGMAMVKGTHQKGILGEHHCCSGGTWYIEMDKEVIEETFDCKMTECEVECKVPYGGVLLFSNSVVHCSYSNTSDYIRWSMDLRWQDPRKPNGRPESNDVMPIFRKNGEQVQNVDWSVMVDRHKNDVTMFNKGEQEQEEDEFDTRISGPWMYRWPIKHHNRHTRQAGVVPEDEI